MGQERDVISPSGETRKFNKDYIEKLSPEQLDEEVATILDRGFTNLRLNVALPPDLHGEWVPNDPGSIAEMQAKGFEIDTKYAMGNALHNDGGNLPKVGDTVYMTCPKILYDSIQRVRAKKFEEMHGTKKKVKNTREEKDYVSQEHGPIKTVNESSKELVGATEIVNAVQAVKDAEAAKLNSKG